MNAPRISPAPALVLLELAEQLDDVVRELARTQPRELVDDKSVARCLRRARDAYERAEVVVELLEGEDRAAKKARDRHAAVGVRLERAEQLERERTRKGRRAS